jgi:riboflavin-specific deaminase-like protein
VFTSCYISPAISSEPITFRRLHPPGPAADVAEIVETLALRERALAAPAARPYVVLNMVSTLDGRATIGGRSAPLSDAADRALFHGLRSVVDAVMAGAGTVTAERYGPLVRDRDTRRRRLERGLAEQPLALVVSGRLTLAHDLRLLADPKSHVAIVTSSTDSLPATGARIEYLRAGRQGRVELRRAFAELRDRFAIQTLLCEGGPHLNGELLSANLVDELFLSLSPTLAGDPARGQPALRILAGVELEHPPELELVSVLEHSSRLFLRYRVTAPDRA